MNRKSTLLIGLHASSAAAVWQEFEGGRETHQVKRLTRGHIHQTYLIESEGSPLAVLQRLNRHVFREPEALIANADLLERHLDASLGDLIARRVHSRSGDAYCIDAQGEYWRAYVYVGQSRNLDAPESESQCYAAGRAFGRFQAALRALRRDDLRICIEGFQDFQIVSRGFASAMCADLRGRLGDSRHLAIRLDALKDQVPPLSGPSGVVHGDGKFNNLLFDQREDRVVAVLDLDTVMWHRRALDYGDLVRAGAVMGDEQDEQAELVIARVQAFAAGFRAGAGDLAPETGQLVDALLHVTCMLSLRFYADHLNGDEYFTVRAPGDNLARAKGQCALLTQLLRRRDEIYGAIERA